MFIQTEQTPNPATLKFLPGCEVMVSGSVEFKDEKTAEDQSPLAHKLFGVEGISGIFLGQNFISVTKTENMDWQDLKPTVLDIVMEHFTTGQPVMFDEAVQQTRDDVLSSHAPSDLDSEIVKQIKELLDSHIRPAVARDGGDVLFHDYKDGIVYVHMQGACSGCPSSTMTLKAGVQNLLQHYIPEISDVQAIEI